MAKAKSGSNQSLENPGWLVFSVVYDLHQRPYPIIAGLQFNRHRRLRDTFTPGREVARAPANGWGGALSRFIDAVIWTALAAWCRYGWLLKTTLKP
jgi:hypothetical protein